MHFSPVLIAIALLALLCQSVLAANWPQWRGPDFNGTSPEANLPVQFSQTGNVAWSVAMPGPSAATPIILDDTVFISSADAAERSMQAMSLDRKTGRVNWQKKVSDHYNRDERSNYASPSPVTDGKIVVFFYGNTDLVAFNFAGTELWRRNLQSEFGNFAFNWTFSSSPTLHEGRLYLPVLQRNVPVNGRGGGESFLLGLEPETGKQLWRVVRPTQARGESHEAYSTPIPATLNGRREILVSGGDLMTGHDPVTGRELWRWDAINPTRATNWRVIVSPIVGGGVVLASAPQNNPVYALKPSDTGILPAGAVAWRSPDRAINADVPTPAFYDGDFFILSDTAKNLTRISPEGKVKWTVATPGSKKYEASPTAADGKIYLMNFGGDVVVMNATDGRVLHTAPMGMPGDDQTRSTISISQGQLFIRTNTKLFCIGKPL